MQTQIDSITTELTSAKATIDAIAGDVGKIVTGIQSLEANVADLQAQVATIKQGGNMDLTNLQAAADALSADVTGLKTAADSAVSALPAAAPAPTPTPAPAPAPSQPTGGA